MTDVDLGELAAIGQMAHKVHIELRSDLSVRKVALDCDGQVIVDHLSKIFGIYIVATALDNGQLRARE